MFNNTFMSPVDLDSLSKFQGSWDQFSPGNMGNWGMGGAMISPTASTGGGWQQTLLGGNGTPGIAQLGLGLLGGLGSTFMGMKQYGMAKKALKQSQDQFNKNYEAQKKLTNSSLEDRQNARIAASGGSGTYQSTADYMKRYGIE